MQPSQALWSSVFPHQRSTAEYLLKPGRFIFDHDVMTVKALWHSLCALIIKYGLTNISLWAAQTHRHINTDVFVHRRTHTVFWDESLFLFINIQWLARFGWTASEAHTLIQTHIIKSFQWKCKWTKLVCLFCVFAFTCTFSEGQFEFQCTVRP